MRKHPAPRTEGRGVVECRLGSGSMGSKRVVAIGVVIVAVVALTGGAFMARKAHATQEACQSVRDYAARTGEVQHLGSAGPRYAVLGDSYSTGDLLADRSDAWTHRLAQTSELDVVAQGGTGYVNAGFCGDGSFLERAAALPDDNDTVIVEGGLNDVDAAPEAIGSAASALYATLGSRRVIVIGPVDAPSVEKERTVDRALRSASHASGAQYVSALSWDVEFGADGKHMTAAGHREYAKRVADVLTAR